MDFQPGGSLHYVMAMGKQEIFGRFDYREISPITRFVYVNAFSDEEGNYTRNPWIPGWPLRVLNAVAFTEANGETTIDLMSWPLTDIPSEMEAFKSAQEGMKTGFKSTLDSLDKYLAELV